MDNILNDTPKSFYARHAMKSRNHFLKYGLESDLVSILVLCGLPGSGKSHFAQKLQAAHPEDNFKIVNRDQLRIMLDSGKYSPSNESFIRHARNAIIRSAVSNRLNVIVDDTNLNPQVRQELIELADETAAIWHMVWFTDVPVDMCIARDNLRIGRLRVGETVIRDMHERWLKPTMEIVND